jgi:hypothetical protein
MTPSASVLAASPMRALSWLTVQAARPVHLQEGQGGQARCILAHAGVVEHAQQRAAPPAHNAPN